MCIYRSNTTGIADGEGYITPWNLWDKPWFWWGSCRIVFSFPWCVLYTAVFFFCRCSFFFDLSFLWYSVDKQGKHHFLNFIYLKRVFRFYFCRKVESQIFEGQGCIRTELWTVDKPICLKQNSKNNSHIHLMVTLPELFYWNILLYIWGFGWG